MSGAPDELASGVAARDWIYQDNGFTSLAAMRQAHDELLDFAGAVLGRSVAEGALLDLGCGNGLLALQLKTRLGARRACGLDRHADVIARAQLLCDSGSDSFKVAPISRTQETFPGETFNLVVVMAGRLTEAGRVPGEGARLCAWLARHAQAVLFYLYEDWFRAAGPLKACPLTGMRPEDPASVLSLHPSGRMAVTRPDKATYESYS